MNSAELIERLRAAGLTVATAESLTGGLLCAALVDAPGASDVVRGAIVAYAPETKVRQLGVPAELIEANGTIDEQVAAAMATGVRAALLADIGVATTGNAGPEGSEGKPVGLVWLAVATPEGVTTRELHLSGDRNSVRERAVHEALSLLGARVGEQPPPAEG